MDGEQRPRQCSNGHHPPRTAPTNTALLTARVHLAYVLPNRSRRCPLFVLVQVQSISYIPAEPVSLDAVHATRGIRNCVL